MKKLTAEQIEMNWQTLIDLIEKYIGDKFPGDENKDKRNKLFYKLSNTLKYLNKNTYSNQFYIIKQNSD